MSKEFDMQREGADYRLYRRKGSETFVFVDKRTGHRTMFHAVTENGFDGHVFLYYHPTGDREEAGRTIGYRAALLDKDSLPDWIIEEFESIHQLGRVTEATDPR